MQCFLNYPYVTFKMYQLVKYSMPVYIFHIVISNQNSVYCIGYPKRKDITEGDKGYDAEIQTRRKQTKNSQLSRTSTYIHKFNKYTNTHTARCVQLCMRYIYEHVHLPKTNSVPYSTAHPVACPCQQEFPRER